MKNFNMDFRSLQPPVVIPESVGIPMASENVLPNGAKIYVLPGDTEWGVVRFSFVFRAGTSWQNVPFSASATVNNLSEGSAGMNALRIAELLDYYGSYFDVNIDRDYSVVTFVCLAKFFEQTLDVAREILICPEFPENEVRIYCGKSKQNLTINRTKVDFIARELFAHSIYGIDHPYGASSDESFYDTLNSTDLREFYRRRYTADNCFIVMSGDATSEREAAVAGLASSLPAGTGGTELIFPPAHNTPYTFKPVEGAVQSAIRIGRVMFPRTHPDYIGMQVVSTILGGYFGSRLIHNLREEHGYTYGAYSAMVNFNHSGYMAIGTEVGAGHTGDAVEQIFIETERLRREIVGKEELSLVKNIMIGEVMRILDGPFGIADVTIENIQNGMNNSYLDSFVKQVRSFTPEKVLEMADKYLGRDELTTVIVGAE